MADAEQMSREELEALRKRVMLQLERLSYWGGGQMTAGKSAFKDKAFVDLHAILDEIDAELAELTGLGPEIESRTIPGWLPGK